MVKVRKGNIDMNKKFYKGFEKRAEEKEAFIAAARAGWNAAKNIYRTSGMRNTIGQLRSSGRRAFNQGKQQLQSAYPKQMASVKAMNKKVKTTATDIMAKAKNKMGY